MSMKSKGEAQSATQKWTLFLCLACFSSGMFFTNWLWTTPRSKSITRITATGAEKLELVSEGCEQTSTRHKDIERGPEQLIRYINKPHQTMQVLNEKISDFERELVAVRAAHISSLNNTSLPNDTTMTVKSSARKRYLMVVGINTAFSSRQRRDSVRATWMPQGGKRKKLEEEKGIIMRFVIGHSTLAGGVLDKAIDEENERHGDIMRLDHVEGYLELSAKTKTYFAAAVSTWDADFYVKVDDDVHANIAILGETLIRHRDKPRVYIGCMKSGPVLAQKGVRYHEPEHWKFGEVGNKYFLHAAGQLYAISKDLATYISVNQHVLHKYANEDVSLGSWFIGLDVNHIDDRRICCATPPDCERKVRGGNTCIASFDWGCSGICRSVERMRIVHRRCAESQDAIWKASF